MAGLMSVLGGAAKKAKKASGDFASKSYGSSQKASGGQEGGGQADGSKAADSALSQAAKGFKKKFRKSSSGKN